MNNRPFSLKHKRPTTKRALKKKGKVGRRARAAYRVSKHKAANALMNSNKK